jgi:hypothetical protein
MMATREYLWRLVLLASLLCGCATWTLVGGRFDGAGAGYEVELPEGWRRFMPVRDGVAITRDGLELQSLRMARLPFDKDPPHTKRKFAKGMLPQEVAEVVIDDFRSNRNVGGFEVAENAPSTVGGYPGFKLVYSYQSAANLRYKGVYYGVLVDQWYYFLYYQAPARYFYERDLPTFEKVRSSLKIVL